MLRAIKFFLFSFVLLVPSQITNASTESIIDFKTTIEIRENGIAHVTEEILYNFGSAQRHGIYREIPLTATDGARMRISGIDANYSHAIRTDQNAVHIKIGDADELVTGTKQYVISYDVAHAIREFEDHDEFYWNVTGNGWSVPITRASAQITAPAIRNVTCFTGAHGSYKQDCDMNLVGGGAFIKTASPLSVGHGLTIAVSMPRGTIAAGEEEDFVTTQTDGVSNRSVGTAFFGFMFGLLIVVANLILKFLGVLRLRRKPKPKIPPELKNRPVIAEFEPPDGLSPIDVGTLLDRRVDNTDISAVIMDLAARGYLKIRYTTRIIPFWPDKKDFELVKLRDGTDLTHPADLLMYGLLFDARDTVTLTELKSTAQSLTAKLKRMDDDTEAHLDKVGYFDAATKKATEKRATQHFILTAVAVFLCIPLALFINQLFFVVAILTLPSFAIYAYKKMRSANLLTEKGVDTLAKILGFREFLLITETERLRMLQAPNAKPEIFEKFLPYAMVLGVETEWAKRFEGMHLDAPSWYEDANGLAFSSVIFAQSMGAFDSTFNQVFSLATTPKTRSGFGGGGFSGGGFGGGGGGSW